MGPADRPPPGSRRKSATRRDVLQKVRFFPIPFVSCRKLARKPSRAIKRQPCRNLVRSSGLASYTLHRPTEFRPGILYLAPPNLTKEIHSAYSLLLCLFAFTATLLRCCGTGLRSQKKSLRAHAPYDKRMVLKYTDRSISAQRKGSSHRNIALIAQIRPYASQFAPRKGNLHRNLALTATWRLAPKRRSGYNRRTGMKA